ncbi:phosphotransferase [Aquibacillus saliphilus]|uniref:phosphotransferase n=1 Tax=Aquibacillus saliphilus TaxID=1909422 RepID=UPI001CEFCE4C|nr:phosphotransferase [Aquibacillus saliphilus]
MDVTRIISELILENKIPLNTTQYKELSGGTVSELYLLNSSDDTSYVVKLNEPQVIESEAYFLEFYKDVELLPNMLFVEQSYKYFVYGFMAGSTNYPINNKKEMLQALVEGLINNYKCVPTNTGWGWADDLSDSWDSFLLNEIIEANTFLTSHLEKDEYNFILDLFNKTHRENRDIQPYLLHGDCGVHNFIFRHGKLTGVIDPTPVIGDPRYDLIYAFCSSPDDLTKETIDSAVSHLRINGAKINSIVYEDVVIGLYLRLATCIKHHPNDFNRYLKAWFYWKDIIKK